jgi:hypothetical protein
VQTVLPLQSLCICVAEFVRQPSLLQGREDGEGTFCRAQLLSKQLDDGRRGRHLEVVVWGVRFWSSIEAEEQWGPHGAVMATAEVFVKAQVFQIRLPFSSVFQSLPLQGLC